MKSISNPTTANNEGSLLVNYSEAVKTAAKKLHESQNAEATFEALNSEGIPTLYWLTNLAHRDNRHLMATHSSIKTGTGVSKIFLLHKTKVLMDKKVA